MNNATRRKLSKPGNYLREYREQRCLTQEDLAALSGVGLRTIGKIEQQVVQAKLPTRQKLMDALGLEWRDHELVFGSMPSMGGRPHKRPGFKPKQPRKRETRRSRRY